MMLVADLPLWAQDVAISGPSVSTVAVAFSGVCFLYLAKLVLQIRGVVLGDGKAGQLGLVADFATLAKTLADHCREERQFWEDVRAQKGQVRAEVANAALAVTMASEERLAAKVDALALRVEQLAERREKSR